jgi:hypothetical protein
MQERRDGSLPPDTRESELLRRSERLSRHTHALPVVEADVCVLSQRRRKAVELSLDLVESPVRADALPDPQSIGTRSERGEAEIVPSKRPESAPGERSDHREDQRCNPREEVRDKSKNRGEERAAQDTLKSLAHATSLRRSLLQRTANCHVSFRKARGWSAVAGPL